MMKDRSPNSTSGMNQFTSDNEDDGEGEYRFGVYMPYCHFAPMEHIWEDDPAYLPGAMEGRTYVKPNEGKEDFQHVEVVMEDGSTSDSEPKSQTSEMAHLTGVEEEFISGFDECAMEAVRYLMDVERLHVGHPFVQGLYRHLMEKKRRLIEGIVCDGDRDLNNEASPSDLHQGVKKSQCEVEPSPFSSEDDTSSCGSVSPLSPASEDLLLIDCSNNINNNVIETSYRPKKSSTKSRNQKKKRNIRL